MPGTAPRFAAVMLSVLVAARAFAADAPLPAFTSVQTELFKPQGALTSAWGDYNNDGRLDVAVTFEHGVVRLYRNDGGGKFTDVSDEMGLGQIVKGPGADKIEVRSAAWGDYDGDGYLDLYVGTLSRDDPANPPLPGARGYLFHNKQGKGFEEVAQKMGVDFPAASARQVSWIDLDHKGLPDVYIPDRNGKNRMFRNDGTKFTEITAQTGLYGPQKTVGVCWFDFDKDGDLDVFMASQEGGRDAFYRNDNGKFTDIAPKLHMDHPERNAEQGGVGCAVGDYDNDGNLDLMVVTYGESYLYHNNGDGTFTDVHKQAGINVTGEMVGASWGDYDNDGLLDLYISGYKHVGTAMEPDNHLFKNIGGGKFVEVNIQGTALNSADHGVQWVDYDNDGALDLSLTDDFSKNFGRHTLLHNDLPAAQRRNALEVTVVDAKGHYTEAGSEVRLYDESGKLLGTRLVATGDGYDSQGTQPVHFGVPADKPVTVEVTFLTRSGRVTQTIANVKPADYAGRTLVVHQN